MTTGRTPPSLRAVRQERVAKIVWGSLFVVMGVLFTLHDMGRIDLGGGAEEFAAGKAVDGDATTRWSSAFRDPQWLVVDLGAVSALGRIRLTWEAAYATDYEVQVSSDGLLWTTVEKVTNGHGDIEEYDLEATGRYVRVRGLKRATRYGYSLWEVEVFDPSGALLSQGKHATASSLEGDGPFGQWVRFWPLLLVATGLPLLVAPRDDANQVVGLVLTALGTFWQLQHLHLVPWGIRETSSLLLIVVGLVILLQSLRRTDGGDKDEPGPAPDAP
jgi:hypothetical protein